MSARRLPEAVSFLIKTQIQNNIVTALADTAADRASAGMAVETLSYEPPRDYFIYEKASAYRTPAIFIIVNDFDWKKDRGTNHVNAVASVDVEAVVDYSTSDRITLLCYRYHDALHEILDQMNLTSTDNKIKIIVEVTKSRFSGVHSRVTEKNAQSTFRMAVLLTLRVEVYENF